VEHRSVGVPLVHVGEARGEGVAAWKRCAGDAQAEEARVAAHQAELEARQRELELEYQQRGQARVAREAELQLDLEYQQRQIKEAEEAEKIKAKAAEQSANDAKAMQLAVAKGAEEARGTQEQRDQETKQRRLEALEKKQRLEAELESKQRAVKTATEAQQAIVQAAQQAARKRQQAIVTPTEPPKELTQPGCYIRIPSGCPALPASTRSELWRKDSYAEKKGLGKEGCEQRKGVWDKYCNSADAEMSFVA